MPYDNNLPWPPLADGHGPSLELTDTALDNSVPYSWAASTNFGTPGRPNSVVPEPAAGALLLIAALAARRRGARRG